MRQRVNQQHLIKVTKALADPTRFRILQAIAGAGETCCGELAQRFPITQATVSQHLKVLAEAGLLEVRREGQFNYYRMVRDLFDDYQHTLAAAFDGISSLNP
jgi:ArsR family transcriptional regulator, arsenate/arsenite/antimonite-responsive transcriptional repressor